MRSSYKSYPKKKTSKKTSRKSSYARLPSRQANALTWVQEYGPERKWINASGTSYTVPDQSQFDTFHLMNGCQQGTGPQNRVGVKCLFKSLDFRYTYYPGVASGATTPNSQVRIVILFDKSTNGALPLLADVWQSAGGGLAKFNDLKNTNTVPERFICIADVLSPISSGVDDSDRMAPVSGHFFRKLNLQTIFRSAGLTVEDINQGSMVITFANNADVAGQQGVLNFAYNLQYTDV